MNEEDKGGEEMKMGFIETYIKKVIVNEEREVDYTEISYNKRLKAFYSVSDNRRREVKRHIEYFYERLNELWGEKVGVALLYSVHALIDALERSLEESEKGEGIQAGESEPGRRKERLEELLLLLVADKGYLFFETRDNVAGKNMDSFNDVYIDRDNRLLFALIDIDAAQKSDLILTFLRRERNGYAGLTSEAHKLLKDGLTPSKSQSPENISPVDRYDHMEWLRDKYFMGAKKVGMEGPDFLKRIQWSVRHMLDSEISEYTEQRFIQEFQNGYKGCPVDLFQKKITEEEMCSPYDEEKKDWEGEINSVEGILRQLFESYVDLDKMIVAHKECLRELSENVITSKEQWEMYEQRETLNEWMPVVRRPLASLLKDVGDESFDFKDVWEDGYLIRRNILQESELKQHEPKFVKIVMRHYEERRKNAKARDYNKGRSVDQRIIGWLRCSLIEGMPISPPIAAYLFLTVPSSKRKMSLKDLAQGKNLGMLKTSAQKREEVRFFFELVKYYRKILVPEEGKISEWIRDFDAITGYLDFVQEAFEESMQQRYSEPVIRGMVKDVKIDYVDVFRKMDEKNPGVRRYFEDKVKKNRDWVENYRKLWTKISTRNQIRIFLESCIGDKSKVYEEIGNMHRVRTRYDDVKEEKVLEWSALKPDQFLTNMLEDVLRKENIKLSCKKVQAMMQKCFPLESDRKNIAEQSQPSQGGISIKEEPSTTP